MVTDVKEDCSAPILRTKQPKKKKKKKKKKKEEGEEVKKIRVAGCPNRPSSLASVKLKVVNVHPIGRAV